MRYVIENAEFGWAELSGMDFIPRAYGEWEFEFESEFIY
jgi:hypothetical protein